MYVAVHMAQTFCGKKESRGGIFSHSKSIYNMHFIPTNTLDSTDDPVRPNNDNGWGMLGPDYVYTRQTGVCFNTMVNRISSVVTQLTSASGGRSRFTDMFQISRRSTATVTAPQQREAKTTI